MNNGRRLLGFMRDSSTIVVYSIYGDGNLFLVIQSRAYRHTCYSHSLERYFAFFLNPNKFPVYFPENYFTV